jgi:hypothetical protein
VAVELAPGVRCEPVEVRRAVGEELKALVIAPAEATSEAAPDTLIVSLDRTRIVVSMRAGLDRWVSRSIGAPADPTARLRAIAWLAGNLARDQVSGLLEQPERDPSPLVPPAVPVAPSGGTATAGVVPVGVARADVVVAVPTQEAGTGWTVSAFGGPTYNVIETDAPGAANWRPIGFTGLGWQVEVQRQRPGTRSLVGFALQLGPERHLLGAAGFLGSRWSRGRWLFEATGGAGIEVVRTMQSEPALVDSTRNGTFSEVQVKLQSVPALCARAGATAGIRLGSVELLARLGAHLTTMSLSQSYLAGTMGVRFEIP